MKKSLFVLVTICLFLCSVSTAFAQDDIAKLNLDYTINDSGNIVVSASVVDITESSGILIMFYDITFDQTKLELVGSKVNMPEKWKPFEDSGMSEVIFNYNKLSDKYVWWSTYAGETNQGYGITKDNEFRIEIELKPLENIETTISFISDSVYSDSDFYLENPLKSESKSISVKAKVDVDNESSETVDNSASQDNSDAENSDNANVSSETDDVSEASSEDHESDNEVEINSQESESDISDDDTSIVQGENSSTDMSTQEESSETAAESNVSHIVENIANVPEDNSKDENTLAIVIASLAGLVVVLIGVFFVVKAKKGK